MPIVHVPVARENRILGGLEGDGADGRRRAGAGPGEGWRRPPRRVDGGHEARPRAMGAFKVTRDEAGEDARVDELWMLV